MFFIPYYLVGNINFILDVPCNRTSVLFSGDVITPEGYFTLDGLEYVSSIVISIFEHHILALI